MIKVTIKNTKTGQESGGQFATQAEAEAWLEQGYEQNWWGYPERWVTEFDLDVAGLSALDSIASKTETTEFGDQVTSYKFPQEYTVSFEDITPILEAEKKVQRNLKRISFGNRLMAELAASNQDDLESGALTLAQVVEAEASLSEVQRLMQNSSLGLAAAKLQTLTIPNMTQEKKILFLKKIQEFLTKEAE